MSTNETRRIRILEFCNESGESFTPRQYAHMILILQAQFVQAYLSQIGQLDKAEKLDSAVNPGHLTNSGMMHSVQDRLLGEEDLLTGEKIVFTVPATTNRNLLSLYRKVVENS